MNHIRSQDFESGREKREVLNDGLRATLMQLDHDNRMNGIISLLADLDGAREDFETALWAAYAFNNLDTYESYLEAEKWLKGVEREGIHSGIWHYRYSVALAFQGKYDEALKISEKGTKVEPDYPWGWLQLARMQYHAGQKNDARYSVDIGLKLIPGDYEFLTLKDAIDNGQDSESVLGHYLSVADDTTAARSQRIARLAHEKKQYESRQARKTLIGRLNRYHAEKEFEKIVEEIQNIPPAERGYELTLLLARANNNLGEHEKAIVQLNTITHQGENDPGWHFQMGAARYYLGKKTLAKGSFERVLELDPDDGDAWQYLIWSCKATGDTSPLLETNASISGIGQVGQSGELPELYSEEELNTVENYIVQTFGEYDFVFHEVFSPDIHVDIAIINPTRARPFYTLVTIGMGAHRMNVPSHLADRKLERAEMLICLPSNWDIQNDDEKWYWPMRWLKVMARLPITNDTWLGWGHTVPHEKPFAANTDLSAMMLINPGLFFMDREQIPCRLPDGDEVRFYQMVPLFEDELNYKQTHDADKLIALLDEDAIIVDVNRKSVCTSSDQKDWKIKRENLKHVLKNWKGPEGCLATDRIMVDGIRIGYMYREKPDPDMPDSGWRFTAGDESSDYMMDPDKAGIYSLNTVCNYDPDIIPLLNAPYGTAYYRDETGQFRETSLEDDDDDDPLQ